MTLQDVTTVLKNPEAIESYSLEAISALATLNPNIPQVKALLLRKRIIAGSEFEVDFTETNYHYGNAPQFIGDVFPIDQEARKRFISESNQTTVADEEIETVDVAALIATGTSSNAAGLMNDVPLQEESVVDSTKAKQEIDSTDELEIKESEQIGVEREFADLTEDIDIEKSSTLIDRIEASPYANWLLGLRQQSPTTISNTEETAPDHTKTKVKKTTSLSENKKSEEPVVGSQVDNSSVLKEEIASQTLAELLAKQGHQEKAISMYEKLSLIIPEKRAYFAAQIKKIKGK